MSESREGHFLRLIRAAGLPEPTRQFARGPHFLDVAYPDRRIAVELDGHATHTGRLAFQRDRTRQNTIVLAGRTILRFTWADITERPEWVLGRLVRALAA